MENANVVVIIMTAVLVLALGAALVAFVIRPNLIKEDDDHRDWDDDDDYYPDGSPRVRDIVRGVNDALQSGYDYDIKQDARLDKVSKDIDDIGKRVPPPPNTTIPAPTTPGTPAPGTPAPGTRPAAITASSGAVSAKKEVFTSGGSSCAKFSYGASHAPGAKCGGSPGTAQGPPSGPVQGPAPAGGDAFDDASFSLPLATF